MIAGFFSNNYRAAFYMSYGLRGIDKKSMKTHVKSVDDMAVDCTWNEESFGTRIEGEEDGDKWCLTG
jgi:hypothetical protein